MRKGLMRGGMLGKRFSDSPDPMAGLSNLADCMLVLACGLMLSLIISWNLDIQIDAQTGQATAAPVTSVEQSEQTIDDSGEFQQMGVVYQDTKTGQMYLVSETEENE